MTYMQAIRSDALFRAQRCHHSTTIILARHMPPECWCAFRDSRRFAAAGAERGGDTRRQDELAQTLAGTSLAPA